MAVALPNTMAVFCSTTDTKFAAEEQQKLEEKAVENQDEHKVENQVDEANKVQMVKKCHLRNSSIRQTLESKRPCETTGGAANFASDPEIAEDAESPSHRSRDEEHEGKMETRMALRAQKSQRRR